MERWPEQRIPVLEEYKVNEEARGVVALHTSESEHALFDQFSELPKLLNFVAYCCRFRNNCKLPKDQRSDEPLSPEEYEDVFRIAQRSAFPAEVKSYTLANNSPNTPHLGPKSPLRNLNLFMDSFGLLRIDNRLRNFSAPVLVF